MDQFGAGVLFATPLQDASGNAISNPSPVQFAILQDVTVDDEFETKELYGALQYPVDIGRGKGKITIKAKFAQINAALFNAVYFGQPSLLTAGYAAIYNDQTGGVIPTGAGATSIHVNTTGGASSSYVADLGVVDAFGVPLTRVAASPTGGQYSLGGFTAGGATYTFSNQDTGKTVFINYQYQNVGVGAPVNGRIQQVINLPMGYAPTFAAQFMVSHAGKTMWRKFPNCIATKLSMDFKNDDFTIPDFEAMAFADAAGNVQYYSTSE